MTPVLSLQDVGFRYRSSGPMTIDGIDLEVHPGDALGIVGESGSGKSTVGGVLCGLLRPTVGRANVLGTEWHRVRRTSRERRSVQMIFQDPYGSLNPLYTPRRTVAEVFRVWERTSTRDADAKAVDVLAEVGIDGSLIDRPVRSLSGGQRQRVGIARVLACQPTVIVADEPTSALDVSVQATVLNLILDLRSSRDLALILISHDLSVVGYMTSRAIVMKDGHIVDSGDTATLMASPTHPYTQALVDSIPRLDLLR